MEALKLTLRVVNQDGTSNRRSCTHLTLPIIVEAILTDNPKAKINIELKEDE